MNQTQTGWIIGIAAAGMMCTLLAGDVSNLQHWKDALYPAFVAGVLTHIGTVIAAFVGGNLVPNMFKSGDTVSAAKRAELSTEKVGV